MNDCEMKIKIIWVNVKCKMEFFPPSSVSDFAVGITIAVAIHFSVKL